MTETREKNPPAPQPEPALQPEPWLRGTLLDVPAAARGVLHALELAREDTRRWCGSLSSDELNAQPLGLPSIGFHLRHIARSLDRLLTYAEANQLSADQIAAMKSEKDPAGGKEALLLEFEQGLAAAARRVRALAAGDLEARRGIGKKQLPASVGGLLVHVADHTQRHVGQAITTAKVVVARWSMSSE